MVLRHFRDDLAALPDLAWIGYLSTVGVYGDWQGQVGRRDERRRGPRPSAACAACWPSRPGSPSAPRAAGASRSSASSGIYGPGRSVIDNLRAGTARRIVKPGQVFNRIHVDDIARVLAAAIDTARRPHHLQRQRRRAGPAAGCRRLRRRAAGPARPARDPVRAGRPHAAWRPASGPRASASATPASRPRSAWSSPIRPTARVCGPSWRVGKVSRTLVRAGAVRQCQRSADFSESSFVCFTMIIIHRTSTRSMANTKPRPK